MYHTSVACACGEVFEAEATHAEVDSSFTCDCGARYLLTVTRLDLQHVN